MRKSFIVITSLILIASFGFGQTVMSVVGTSVDNGTEFARVDISLANTETVGGLQFSLKDIPNQLSVATVSAAGRSAAEPLEDTNNDGIWTPGETYTDVNGNGSWDGAFSVEFNDRDSTVSVLIFDASGNSIIPGVGPICSIYFAVPASVSDEIIDLKFHEILDADPQFLLVVTDPDGNAVNTTWMNGFLTVGGIEVNISSPGSGTPGYVVLDPIVIEMDNGVPVKGIQFNLLDGVDYLSIVSVNGLGRASDFTFVGNEVNGQSMVLGVNFSGLEIPAGTGEILEIYVMVSPSAPLGPLPISISQLIVAAEGGIPLPSNGGEAIFNSVTGVEENELPTAFGLAQNFPNPFNPTTTIEYSVPEASDIRVGIYNLLGQEIRTLAVGDHQPGFYTTMWDGLNQNGIRVESGVYLYRMSSTTGYSATKKLVLLK